MRKAPPDICIASSKSNEFVVRRDDIKSFNLSFLKFDFPCEQFLNIRENDLNACVTNYGAFVKWKMSLSFDTITCKMMTMMPNNNNKKIKIH